MFFLCNNHTQLKLGWMRWTAICSCWALTKWVMAVNTSSRLSLVDCDSVNIRGINIPFKTSVKYLGVKIDRTLSTQDQINSVCHASFLELRHLASIQPYLSKRTSARLVATLITSDLDYCKAVFAGLPLEQIGQLQRVQNSAAQLVLKKQKWDHITPLLNELHWLPVKFCSKYKTETLAYCHFHGTLPSYLSAFLCTYQTSSILWSSSEKLFENPWMLSPIFWWPFFQFHCSNCLEFAVCQFAESRHPPWLQR